MTRDIRAGGIGRRTFLKASAAAGAATGLGVLPWATAVNASTGHLRAGLVGFSVVNSLDPARAALNSDFWALSALYNGLLRLTPEMTLEPELAESWSRDGETALVFNLRRGVKFHDGTEMTAEDVKFSLDRVRDADFGSPSRGKYAAIESVEAVDPYTVRITTAEPFAPLATFLHNGTTGSQIVSKAAYESMGAEAFGRAPVGTGPFKIVEWRPNERIVMTAHTDYFIAGQPAAARCDIILIPEETSGATALKAGDIDVASSLPFAEATQLEQDPSISISRLSGMNYRLTVLNNNRAPFDDPHFRRAVSMALNREAVVKAALFGEGSAMWGCTPPAIGWAFRKDPREVCVFNPEKARAELAKSRYKADEHEVAVETWGSGWWKRWTEVFVANVNQVLGTRFRVDVLDPNTAFQRYKAMECTAQCTGWIGRMEVDEYMGDCFHTKGSRNFVKYSNPKVDELIEKGRAEFDQAKRGQYYIQAEDLCVEDCPVIFAINNNAHSMWRKGVEGWVPTAGQALGSQLGPVSVPE